MSERHVIANQKKILKNQQAILANQGQIKANQETIKKNQATILKNQRQSSPTIIKNQKADLGRRQEVAPAYTLSRRFRSPKTQIAPIVYLRYCSPCSPPTISPPLVLVDSRCA